MIPGIKTDNMDKLMEGLQALSGKAVYVGIPDSTAGRTPEEGEKSPASNAVIGYVQETGDPERNLPARPFLVPGVESAEDAINGRLAKAGVAAMDGNVEVVNASMEAAGMAAASAVKRKINSGEFDPLSEATLKARARRGRKGAKKELARRAAGEDPGTEFARPLVDTGQLRNSVTYVVRKNGST